jgi:PAS domain S-box-containing protein
MFYWSRRIERRSGVETAYDMDAELEKITGRKDLSKDNETYARQVIHPDDQAMTLAIYTAFERRETDRYQVEYRLLCADGSYLPVRAWVERLQDPVTQDDLIAGVIQDISTEKQRERQLLAAKSAAEASNRAKGEFLTNMSHELRTPLNAVIGFSDLLKMNETVQQDQRLAAYVDAVNDSGRNLLEIINAILDMARLDSAERTLHERRFPLADALADVARLMEPRARDKGVQLRFPMIVPQTDSAPIDIDTGAAADAGHLDRHVMILAEDHAMRQILGNVLSNAIKFTASGGVVTLTTRIESNGDLAIAITDTGSGIDAKLIPLLALPFTQAGSAWTRRKGGIGLGLAIARKLLELHQGRLEIESQPGRGTRMTLIFPASRLAPPDAATILTQQTQR